MKIGTSEGRDRLWKLYHDKTGKSERERREREKMYLEQLDSFNRELGRADNSRGGGRCGGDRCWISKPLRAIVMAFPAVLGALYFHAFPADLEKINYSAARVE